MESIKSTSAPTKSKLAKTFKKVIHLKTATKALSNNGFCLLIPHEKLSCCDPKHGSHPFDKEDTDDEAKSRNKAATEAFIAKLFATISAVKAAYAELQMAQFPYNGEAIQSADQAVVDELKTLSELKQTFLKKQIDSSPPHVTVLLAEIQEQQSLMKTYEITMKKMQSEIQSRESQITLLQKEFNETTMSNKSLENKLNSSGLFSLFENIKFADSSPKDFILVLHYALRSLRNFVKLMVREMESKNWDIDAASDAIEPEVIFRKTNHKCFAFESFVCKEMFDGFNNPNFSNPNESFSSSDGEQLRLMYYEQFKRLKSLNSMQFLNHYPNSSFEKFTRTKYLRLIHPKMEVSFSGDLNPRKMVSAGKYPPDTPFFGAFVEMARRVWLLHCLAFSFDQEVSIFQVAKNCRFSDIYMESVTDDLFAAAEGDFRVAFTVVPGFKIGKTVVQSQVYLSPAGSPARS